LANQFVVDQSALGGSQVSRRDVDSRSEQDFLDISDSNLSLVLPILWAMAPG
jgi:hypothetical protein